MNLDKLNTESINQDTENIDNISTTEILKLINNQDKKVAEAVEEEIDNISKLVDEIVFCFNNGGRLVYMGAGTSGRLGILDASECPPTYGVENDKVMGIIAGGDKALRDAIEGAEDIKEYGEQDLKDINLKKEDIVVGIAASGRTPYVIGGLEYARGIGCKTGAISCTKNAELSKYVDTSIEVDTGAEVISGSTRMKAGTAQKLVLNMLSTASMIKIGKVYKNYMVDVKATNIKLRERSKNIIIQITNCSYERAEELLEKSNYNVKLSILMEITNLEYKEAKNLLDKNSGFLRDAIKEGEL